MRRIFLEDLKLAVRQAGIDVTIEDFRETNIKKGGKAVTSIIEIDKGDGIKIFSKCYDTSLYPGVRGYSPLEKQLSDELGTEESFDYERKILKTLNDVDKDIAPILYSVVEGQKRIFMEYIEDRSLQWKFIELDKEIVRLEEEIKGLKSDKGISERKNEIQNLKRQKEYWVKKSVEYIAGFKKACNNSADRFRKFSIRELSKKDDRAVFEDYLLRILLYSNDNLKSIENVKSFLKDKGINILVYSSELAEYFFREVTSDEEIALIHGDMGPHHVRLNGKIIDFDEFREGSYYYDLVRFLKNPFVNQPERKIPQYLANYLLKEILNGEKIKQEEIEKLTIENMVNGIIGRERFASSLKRFYDINLREDIHIAAVLRKYSPAAIKFFTREHPIYKSKKKLIEWRLDDISNILKILLSNYGREYLLRDRYSIETIENLRSFFETTGLIRIAPSDIFYLFGKEENPDTNKDKKLRNHKNKIYA